MNYVEFVFCVVPTKLVPLAMVFLVSDVMRWHDIHIVDKRLCVYILGFDSNNVLRFMLQLEMDYPCIHPHLLLLLHDCCTVS